jgi:hypothetical protein
MSPSGFKTVSDPVIATHEQLSPAFHAKIQVFQTTVSGFL